MYPVEFWFYASGRGGGGILHREMSVTSIPVPWRRFHFPEDEGPGVGWLVRRCVWVQPEGKFVCELAGDEDPASDWLEMLGRYEACGWSVEEQQTLWEESFDPDDTWIEDPEDEEEVKLPAWVRDCEGQG